MHDTLNAIQRRYAPNACDDFAPGASPTAAVATAAHDVLVAAFPPGAAAYTADFNEVRGKDALVGSTRTADESEIAQFWVKNSPLGWNRIARTAAAVHSLDGWQLARLFALTRLAVAGAHLAAFDTKDFHRFWCPYSAVRFADADDNSDTVADAAWLPFAPVTPPVPDYNSAHSAVGGPAQ